MIFSAIRFNRNLSKAFFVLTVVLAAVLAPQSVVGQSPAIIYQNIAAIPSPVRWCLPEAGDDPAGIIGGRCKVYKECLAASGLTESVDEVGFNGLSDQKIEEVRKCHQSLYNGAKVNPQIKGSAATQQWLMHSVYKGTEAKSFAIPNSFPTPR